MSHDEARTWKAVAYDKLLGELKFLITEWREKEKNSPYGLDEYGAKIPALDGNQCATDIEELLPPGEGHTFAATEFYKDR